MMHAARNHTRSAPLTAGIARQGAFLVKQVAILTLAACTFVAGCASYSERVVEKPVPARSAERTVVYNTPTAPAQTTTVYTTR